VREAEIRPLRKPGRKESRKGERGLQNEKLRVKTPKETRKKRSQEREKRFYVFGVWRFD
jgi:hypothetical protein